MFAKYAQTAKTLMTLVNGGMQIGGLLDLANAQGKYFNDAQIARIKMVLGDLAAQKASDVNVMTVVNLVMRKPESLDIIKELVEEKTKSKSDCKQEVLRAANSFECPECKSVTFYTFTPHLIRG